VTAVYDKLSPTKTLQLLRADFLGPMCSIANIFAGKKGNLVFILHLKRQCLCGYQSCLFPSL